MKYELLIQHNKTLYYPPITDGVSIEWERKGQPGKLSFDVIETDKLNFEEGDACRFSVNGTPIFYGFVFEKSKQGKSPNQIKVTVYDQLYYFKNKDTYVYANKTATEVVKMIAEDFRLNIGFLENTGYKIESRTEDNVSLFDIVQNALDETLKAKTQMYVLYDDVGKLTLKNIGNMKINLIITDETAADYDYKTSIAENTYNKIKLTYDDTEAGVRQVYIAQDSSNINKWGVLQYYEQINNTEYAKAKVNGLLNLYNSKTRTLSIKNTLGDIRVHAGVMLPIILNLGDMKVQNYLLVEQCKHTFKDNQHLMDLKLRGDGFVT